MSWETFYLFCFVIGFALSLLSALGGGSHFHMPHLHLHGHFHAGNVAGSGGHAGVSPVNMSTFSAFLAWFGGVGYLLTRFSSVWAMVALCFALLAGLVGGAIVFWFFVKVMLKHDRALDPADFEMIGVLGRVSSAVRPGGTGGMIFSRNGARASASIRSEDGTAIARATEVVVTRYESGIAYVRPWEELSGAK